MKIARYHIPLLVSAASIILSACSGGSSSDQQPAGAARAQAATAVAPQPSVAVSVSPFKTVALAPTPTSAVTPSKSAGACSIDGIGGAAVDSSQGSYQLKKAPPALFSGWIVTGEKQDPKHFLLLFKGNDTFSAASSTGQARPDIAKIYGVGAEQTGFQFLVDISSVNAGTYDVLLQESGANGTVVCDPHKQVIVTD